MKAPLLTAACIMLFSGFAQSDNATLGEIVARELSLARELGLRLKIHDNCPISEDEARISSLRRLSDHGIPVANESQFFYITIEALCMNHSDGHIVYSGSLQLHIPVLLPSQIMLDPMDQQIAVMPIWTAKRYGVLGTPPSSLQARALFAEVDMMIDELNSMWVKAR